MLYDIPNNPQILKYHCAGIVEVVDTVYFDPMFLLDYTWGYHKKIEGGLNGHGSVVSIEYLLENKELVNANRPYVIFVKPDQGIYNYIIYSKS